MASQRYVILPLAFVLCLLGIYGSAGYLTSSSSPLEGVVRQVTTHNDEGNDENELLRRLKEDLDEKQRIVQDLQNQIEEAKKQNEELRVQLQTCETKREANKDAMTTITEERIATKNPTIHSRHPVCQQLGHDKTQKDNFVIPSAPFLWTEFLSEIHTASNLLPNDPKYAFHDFTAQLLHLVSSRLPRTTQTLPRNWESFHSILEIGWRRYWYFQSHPEALQPSTPGQPPTLNKTYADQHAIPRPIRILIMGGSLLQGTNCRKMIRDLNLQMWLPLKHCNWGHRLGALLNQFFGAPLVEVTNIGVGGTNTATGSLLLHHELLPKQAKNPDVVLNGYSTNDMHVWTMEQAGHDNTTLEDEVRSMVEGFYRNATRLCSESKVEPLIVYLDDYMGNEQRGILSTMEGSSAVQSLARYYGFATFSYPNLVMDWIYGDTHETWFSPEGWYLHGDAMEREIHPQLGMHIVAAWVVAYNMLNMATTFCSIELWRLTGGDDMLQQSYEATRQSIPQLPTLNNETQNIPKGRPRAPPNGLPPHLTRSLLLDHVSKLWAQESTEERKQKETSWCQEGDNTDRPKCPFAWITRIRVVPLPGVPETELENDGQAENAYWKAHAITDFGDPKTSDWAFQSDHMKVGVVPMKGVGSKLLIEIPALSASIPPTNDGAALVDTITLFYMKSYGDKWMDSTILLNVMSKSASQQASDDWKSLSSVELTGFHAKNTSETYTETLRLDNAAEIQRLRVGATLIRGQTFKIMGLLACRTKELQR